ncbi:MAG: cytochrome B [Novosphingobium sp. 17-62-19]|uniref:cytochrome b n=1 Tax=Novosphingobium sp. 17-62-19 TaxID=1970406 RepID=UPI000BD1F28E|nr:cytochrome b [Novosphingobium sp. 17-62-19]OYX90686.1 MAG: cytochrome B [Novosphingobium sp. 35-62-5]OZA21242.1 MAG: cytochrome B [Novosphingobium sp. 17-62-19]HQS96140.1 cytochrome b [Novosphingobium sp.]
MATIANTQAIVRYNAVARALHATIAALVVFNLVSGIGGEAIENFWNPYPLHKGTGMVILVLSLARIGWRFTWTTPEWPTTMGRLQRLTAKGTHATLYVLMLVLPVTGWIMSSANSKYPISIWGLFEWPKLAVAKGSALAEVSHEGHEVLGFLMAGLVVLHIVAALHHHFIIKDNILRRMF